MDSCRHADDISRSDRCGKSGTKSLETVNIAVSRIFCLENKAQCLGKAENLEKLQTNRQPDTRPDKKNQKGRSPDEAINLIQQCHKIHKNPPLKSEIKNRLTKPKLRSRK